VDNGRRIDLGAIRDEAEQQLGSATIWSPTYAACARASRVRCRPSVISSRSRSPGTTWRRTWRR
jgi:hypothetical protein